MILYNEKNFADLSYRLVAFSLVISLFIYILPWDKSLKILLPDFPLLTVLFVIRHSPKRYGLILAFSIGLIQDVLLFMPLGLNAFIFLSSAVICLIFFNRPYQISNVQEAILTFILFFLSKIIHLIALELLLTEPNYGEVMIPLIISLFFSTALWMMMRALVLLYYSDR